MILWQPSEQRKAQSNLARFLTHVERRWGNHVSGHHELYSWSIDQPEQFWETVWDFSGILSSQRDSTVLRNRELMPGAEWFPDAKLNFAENLLRYRDDHAAIVFWGEARIRRSLSYRELHSQVRSVAAAFRDFGLKAGDRVAGCVPNVPESIVCMLAASSLGAVWSSCSPDFGASGILDRFGQIAPKILLCSDGYFFKDQIIETLPKIDDVCRKLPSLEKLIVIPYVAECPQLLPLGAELRKRAVVFNDLLNAATEPALSFTQLPFNHPLYIMFSSGTTGKPTCIVHGAGGTLIEHLKELLLHTDLKRSDHIFYQTTCGWMMWNWLVSSLAVGATVVLYDGAPFHRDGQILWDMAEREGVTIFGTNAKYLSACEKSNLKPLHSHNLSAMHTILSTGSPLLPESFDYVYRDIKQDVCLSSISGGTDIIGCFALGSPLLPVHRGELQSRSLALKVEVFNERGQPMSGEKGELVCTAPFPSMPISFWDDPHQERYRNAYFSRFPNIWYHGDYVELTENGGMVFYGRSDAVLNPGGIRIGTAEIYRQVEQVPEVAECVAVGQEWEGDVRVILFVKMQPGFSLNDEIQNHIRQVIRKNTTPFHVPKKILEVPDIPRTRSGKIVELAIRDVIHEQAVKNLEALANPEALEHFRNVAELREA